MSNLIDALLFVATSGLISIIAYRLYTMMDLEQVEPHQFILKKGSFFFISVMLTLLSFFAMLSDPTNLLAIFIHRLNVVLFVITVIMAIIDIGFYLSYVASYKRNK